MVTKCKYKGWVLYSLNVNVPTDTMLKFDANIEAKVNVDANCERALTKICHVTSKQLLFFDDPTLCKKT